MRASVLACVLACVAVVDQYAQVSAAAHFFVEGEEVRLGLRIVHADAVVRAIEAVVRLWGMGGWNGVGHRGGRASAGRVQGERGEDVYETASYLDMQRRAHIRAVQPQFHRVARAGVVVQPPAPRRRAIVGHGKCPPAAAVAAAKGLVVDAVIVERVAAAEGANGVCSGVRAGGRGGGAAVHVYAGACVHECACAQVCECVRVRVRVHMRVRTWGSAQGSWSRTDAWT